MKKLTDKEEEIMTFFWNNGPLYVRQIIDMMEKPRPHFNTVSTFVRMLEQKGFLYHEKTGNSYIYKPVVSREEYSSSALSSVVDKYFGSSVLNAASTLVREKHLSDSEIAELIELVKSQNKEERL